MENRNWNVGDVVRLKSGSPQMTVSGIRSGPKGEVMVDVEWFKEGKEPQNRTYPSEVLKEVSFEQDESPLLMKPDPII